MVASSYTYFSGAVWSAGDLCSRDSGGAVCLYILLTRTDLQK